jgi:hypothetical protein
VLNISRGWLSYYWQCPCHAAVALINIGSIRLKGMLREMANFVSGQIDRFSFTIDSVPPGEIYFARKKSLGNEAYLY